jgi:hypothetical protein
MMTEVIQILGSDQIREGLFIPLDLFAGHEGIEVRIDDDGVVTIQPRERTLAEVCQSIDKRRESLQTGYGLMDDSSLLIREDRDRR